MTLKKRIVIVFIPLLFVCALLVGDLFAPPEPIANVLSSIFASQTYRTSPCWRSITPGITNEDNLVTIVAHRQIVC